MASELADRVIGGVLGLCLGDALGAPFEDRRAADVPSPVPAFELAWRGLPPGTSTGHSSMASHLLSSLLAKEGLDPDDVLDRHVAWLAEDPPDVDRFTRRVLVRVQGGDRDAARHVWEERGPEVSAGNGSVAYSPPLGLAYANRPDVLHELAPALCAITHWDQRCRTAVTAVALCAAALARGEPPAPSVQAALVAVQDRPGGEELEHLVASVGVDRPIDGPDRGFCLFTAAIALQAAAEGDEMEPSLRCVVAHGGDTAANAAAAGSLLGALHGVSRIPREWVRRMVDADRLRADAIALVRLAETG